MNYNFDLLKKTSIFTGLTGEEIQAALNCLHAKIEDYPKGTYLLRTGDHVEAVGLLLAGRTLIVQEDFWGNRNLLANILPGQLFAEAFACSPGEVMRCSVVADMMCSVAWLDINRVLNICPASCGHHKRMVQNLISDLARKSIQLNEKLTHMGQRTTREKLLSYLSAEAQRQGTTRFYIPFNRQQLADYLSVERSAMSNALCKLRDEGVLSFQKNYFQLYKHSAT